MSRNREVDADERPSPLSIDGSHGEGGGQIVRTALSLSAVTGRGVRIRNIRANRRNPGLAAQHVTATRAMAAVCGARLAGDELNSTELVFEPSQPARPGHYTFDVGAARTGGSAGAVTLVLQTLVPPLVLVPGRSVLSLHGGTHMIWSPSFDYAARVWLPALRQIGVVGTLELRRSGWYPAGGGEIAATIEGLRGEDKLHGLNLVEPGGLQRVTGRALVANLPRRIAERMADRASALLAEAGIASDIEAIGLHAACAGAGIFLQAVYEKVTAGFDALGRRGKPAEVVAEEAVTAFRRHHRSGAAVDMHLADQLLLPLALAGEPSTFTTPVPTPHLETNAWVIDRFGLGVIGGHPDGFGRHRVEIVPNRGESI